MINIIVKLLKLLNLKNSPQNTNTNETLEIVSLTSESFEDIQNEFIKIMDDNQMSYKLPIDWERYFLNYFKLKSANEIVGFALTEKKFPVNLSKFAISNKWKSRGIGKVALKLWEDYNNLIFKKLNVYNYLIHLECDKNTIGFYKKQGYKQYGGYKLEKEGEVLDRIFMKKFIILKD